MKPVIFNSILTLALLAAACSGSKVATTLAVSHKTLAENAATEGNFTAATEAWKNYFAASALEQIAGSDFVEAAQMAFKSGNAVQAVEWFEQAKYKSVANADFYLALAEMLNTQLNISKELTAVEFVETNNSESEGEVSEQLFEIHNNIDEQQNALAAFKKNSEAQKSELPLIADFLEVNEMLNYSLSNDILSLRILEKQPDCLEALEWFALKHYRKGETRYKSEINKYIKNKNKTQYKILLEQLELANCDYKKSLIYLEKMWKLESGKKYASYFITIYNRFGDEAKAKSYEKYLNE